MFLLTVNCYEDRTVKGVFPSVHMAKKYVTKIMRREVEWSEPSPVSGIISAYFGGGYINIEPGELNPKN